MKAFFIVLSCLPAWMMFTRACIRRYRGGYGYGESGSYGSF